MAYHFLVLLLVSSVYTNESDEGYPRYLGEEYNETAKQTRQQKYRLKNVIVDWMPQEEDENVYEKVEDIGHRLGIDNPLNDVEKAHRLNLDLEGKPNPIVIRLRNVTLRQKWTGYYRGKRLWQEGWYLNEHLTPATQHLLHQAKDWAKHNGYKWVWTEDCVVNIRKGPGYPPRSIQHVSQLLKLGPMPNKDPNVEKGIDMQEQMKTTTTERLNAVHGITPRQHNDIDITPRQHNDIDITPRQHNDIDITPRQHNDIDITPRQHNDIDIMHAKTT
uniref:FP protein C-terminal domain-containing protein n=1 Tax=Cacopsylla melanoneura TaxID=428564 RepID=A0A8D8QES9_9HEMI